MFDNTATVELEGPTGEQRLIENVESVTTRDDGTIDVSVSDRTDMIEVGWDWTIRGVYVAHETVETVECDDWITYIRKDQIRRGQVTGTHGDEITVKELPDGWMTAIHRSDIIPV